MTQVTAAHRTRITTTRRTSHASSEIPSLSHTFVGNTKWSAHCTAAEIPKFNATDTSALIKARRTAALSTPVDNPQAVEKAAHMSERGCTRDTESSITLPKIRAVASRWCYRNNNALHVMMGVVAESTQRLPLPPANVRMGAAHCRRQAGGSHRPVPPRHGSPFAVMPGGSLHFQPSLPSCRSPRVPFTPSYDLQWLSPTLPQCMIVPDITYVTGPTLPSQALHDNTLYPNQCMMLPFITSPIWWYLSSHAFQDDTIHHTHGMMIPFHHTLWIMTPVTASVAWYNFTRNSMHDNIHHQIHCKMIPIITCITWWYLSSHALHDDTIHHMHSMIIPFHHNDTFHYMRCMMIPFIPSNAFITGLTWWYL